MNGYIRLHRQLLEWEWHTDCKTFSVFIHLLLRARFADGLWQGKQIKAGQIITSYQSIADDVGLSVQSVRTVISHLKSTGEITVNATNKYSLITITNWELYQSKEDELTNKPTDQLTGNQQANQQATNNQSTGNQQQRNNVNKGNKGIVVTARARTRENSHSGFLSEEEMTELADGIHTVLDEAKRAGFPDTQADWDKGNALVADYGSDAVITAIKTCTDRPMEKRNWGYARGILESDPTGGGRKKSGSSQMSDMQRRQKAFEDRRSALIIAGKHEEASKLRMSDVEVAI